MALGSYLTTSSMGRSGLALLLVLIVGGGCDRSKLPFYGQLGENCYPNGTCAPGLVCVAERCRQGPAVDASVDLAPDGGDAAPREQGPDLPACWPPGSSCAPDDPCASGGICSDQGRCESQGGCDDGLPCTEDRCVGAGKCEYVAKAGSCALVVNLVDRRCFKDGESHPDDSCRRCDAKADNTVWTPVTDGTLCDDGDLCTGPDVCQQGVCSSAASSCDDGLPCTKDACDGKGGCLPVVIEPGSCVVDKTCYKSGDVGKDATGTCGVCEPSSGQTSFAPTSACLIGAICVQPGGQHPTAGSCASCDPKSATDDWTIAAGKCLIDGNCHAGGAAGPSACETCDPTVDARAWSNKSGSCAIAGACLADQAKHSSGCMRCDVATSPSAWSPVGANTTLEAQNFEAPSLPAEWTAQNSHPQVRWQVATKRARGGSKAMYYGDLAKGSYDSSPQKNSGSLSWKIGALPTGKAGLRFYYWADVENNNQFDKLELTLVSGTVEKSLWTRPSGQTGLRNWREVDIDLSAYAGQSNLILRWSFDSVDALNNKGEGIYLDEIVLYSGC